ncbi:site-specific integrase [Pedobacter sp. ISL-68]|uniref:site-specific integrase n=1 Tax=unclassified Pedobacter TaxID=2628915 RepID=UPI001BEA0DBA|nr:MULTISPECIES: site-specific integrase [unclassified Pedobacter]MBT2560068.1 site-specific integrase [Pedobacter sp. ISL-64]MBT2589047.1 site-specific integrase [Pedobacter sp. ISL-68]
MATVDAKIYVHHYKNDGTCNVKIRIYHKNQQRFIETTHFLCDKQLKRHPENKREFLIKDQFVKSLVNSELDSYRLAISNLGPKLHLFSADELKRYLTRTDERIDFIAFCNGFIAGLEESSRGKSAANYRTVKNSLIDFLGKERIFIEEINCDMLGDWERYLRSKRVITRLNQFQKPISTFQHPLKDASVHNYMRDLRGLFNHARKKYNRKSLGIIRIEHYPFDEYKIVEAPLTRKRNTDIDTLKLIRDSSPLPESRAELARDLFMLSFYMCGINAVDIFKVDKSNIVGGRLDYNRSKTKDKRKDNAFISIKVVAQAKPLINKYIGTISQRYGNIGSLNKALSAGMRELCKQIDAKGITYYWARHTVGNLARNKCRMSKDDVGLALNHVDQGKRVTDIYVDKDWSIIDELQERVLKLLEEKESDKE